jgi:hypothetical protein
MDYDGLDVPGAPRRSMLSCLRDSVLQRFRCSR